MTGTSDRDQFNRIWKRKLRDDLASKLAIGTNLRVDKALEVLNSGTRLLDIGCGCGTLLAQLQNRFEEACGVDISDEAIQAARRQGLMAQVVNLNSEPLPYPDGHFQAVTMLSTLQYFYDPNLILHESYRVLLPSGILLVSVPNLRAFWRIGRLLFRGSFPRVSMDSEGYDGGTLHYFAFANLKNLLEGNGFKVKSANGIFCLPRFLEHLPQVMPWNVLKREFFGAEIFTVAVKTSGCL